MKTCPRCNQSVDDEFRHCPHDGAALESDPLIGRVIDGRYRVVSQLGEGGTALVYLAHHETMRRTVALKMLGPRLASSELAIARFQREAGAVSRIDHENVVEVFDFGLAPEGFHYLAMEFVPGRSLERELASPMRSERVIHILAQVASGTSRAHELGIVHRDLKPENIMLCDRYGDPDFVKILDFGLASAIEPQDTPLTQEGQVFGTPQYMSPEQWMGGPADPRMDIYSLGIMGYELLTGALPYRGGMAELMAQHLTAEPAPMSASIPDALREVILRCVAKEPERRFASAAELLQALRAVSAPPPSVRRTTYAPSAQRSPGTIPDPTVYQSQQLDVVWDGPSLAGEIRRLHLLRSNRFAELVHQVWPNELPPEVMQLRSRIETLEQQVDETGQVILALRVSLDGLLESSRAEAGALRGDIVDANATLTHLRRSGGRGTATTLTIDASAFAQPLGSPTLGEPSAREALQRAERKLASVERRSLRERLNLEAQLADSMACLREAELELMPLGEELARWVRQAAKGRRDLRPALVEFGKIDGAVAAYQALMQTLEVD